MKYGCLNFLEPSGQLQACNRTAWTTTFSQVCNWVYLDISSNVFLFVIPPLSVPLDLAPFLSRHFPFASLPPFWLNSPKWARASSFTRFLDHTQRRTTVGRTPLDEWPDNTQHSQQTGTHVPDGIRTHNLSRRATADLRLRPCGHCDRPIAFYFHKSYLIFTNSMILLLPITFLYVIYSLICSHTVPKNCSPHLCVSLHFSNSWTTFSSCYTGGISLSSAPLGFYIPSLNHANPFLSFQATNTLIRTRSTNYGTERFRSWRYTVSCSKVMSVQYAMSASLMFVTIDIRQITWNLSISNCGWIETTVTTILPEDLHAFLHAHRAWLGRKSMRVKVLHSPTDALVY
jgi:hypothetical protein